MLVPLNDKVTEETARLTSWHSKRQLFHLLASLGGRRGHRRGAACRACFAPNLLSCSPVGTEPFHKPCACGTPEAVAA
jgi:hypothetical protein